MNTPRKVYLALACCILGYLIVSLGTPPDPGVMNKYHLSLVQAQLLSLSIVLPFAGIWILGVFGSVELLKYAQPIHANKDGRAFWHIAVGTGILAFRFPVSALITALLRYLDRYTSDLAPVTTIFNNYFSVAAAVGGFSLIGLGAAQLLQLSHKQPTNRGRLLYTITTLSLAAAYTYLAIGQPGYQTPLSPGDRATYYLPAWLIVSSIVLPFIYAWNKGLAAVFDLYFYRKTVPGVVYRQVLRLLTFGVGTVILSSVMFQFLGAQGFRLNRMQLGPLLLVLYLLLLATAVGYAYIAMGAKKLRRIEEV